MTVPLFDAAGNVTGIYGRRVDGAEPHHLYLPGPRRGLWNGTAAKTNQTLIVAEAILDGMALWQAGFKNTIAIYGTNGWTPDHAQLLKDNGTTELFLCLDNDEAGRKGNEQLKEKVASQVKTVHAVTWPDGVKDAAAFFLSRSPEEFRWLLEATTPKPKSPSATGGATEQGSQDQVTMTPDGFNVTYQTRRYELRGVEKSSASRLKATIRATGDQGRFVVDTVDFYLSRSRRGFLSEAARLFHETVDTIEGDLNKITIQLETFGQSIEDLSRPGQQLLGLISDYVQRQASQQNTTLDKITFSRRQLRESLKWSEYQLRTYLHELAELEYVCPLAGRQGQPFQYRLLYEGQGQNGQRFLAGLKSVEQLRQETRQLGLSIDQAPNREQPPASRPKNQLRDANGNFEGASLNASHEVAPCSQPCESRGLSDTAPTSSQLAGELTSDLHKNRINGSLVTVANGGNQ